MGLGKILKAISGPPTSVIKRAGRNIKLAQKAHAVEELEKQAGRKLTKQEIEDNLPEHLQDLNEKGKKIKPLTTDTNEKIIKAVKKQAKKEWQDAEELSAGVEVVANKAAKALFEKVDYEETGDALRDFSNKMVHPFGYKMKTAPALAIGAGVIALSAGDAAMQVKNRNSMGYISAGKMANMVNETHSPGIYSDRALDELAKPRRNPYSNHGAEGDIVFALHNMR